MSITLEQIVIQLQGAREAEAQLKAARKAEDELAAGAKAAAAEAKALETNIDKMNAAVGRLIAEQKRLRAAGIDRALEGARKSYGEQESGLNRVISSVMSAKGAFLAMGGAAAISAAKTTYELGKLGAQAKDVEAAFRMAGGTASQFSNAMGNLNGAVSDDFLLRQFNMAKTLGISSDQFAQLTKVAKAASVTLGQDLDYMLQSVTVGVARQSKLWLDNLGILVDVDGANQRMATSLGTTVGKLTEAQKRQAFFNDVMRAAKPLMDHAPTDAAADAYGRFAAKVENAKVRLGKLVDTVATGPIGTTLLGAMEALNPALAATHLYFELLGASAAEDSSVFDLMASAMRNLRAETSSLATEWRRMLNVATTRPGEQQAAFGAMVSGLPRRAGAAVQGEALGLYGAAGGWLTQQRMLWEPKINKWQEVERANARRKPKRPKPWSDFLSGLETPEDVGARADRLMARQAGADRLSEQMIPTADLDAAAAAADSLSDSLDSMERAWGSAFSEIRGAKSIDVLGDIRDQFTDMAVSISTGADLAISAVSGLTSALGTFAANAIITGEASGKALGKIAGNTLASLSAQAFGYAVFLEGFALAATVIPALWGFAGPAATAGLVMAGIGTALAVGARALGADPLMGEGGRGKSGGGARTVADRNRDTWGAGGGGGGGSMTTIVNVVLGSQTLHREVVRTADDDRRRMVRGRRLVQAGVA